MKKVIKLLSEAYLMAKRFNSGDKEAKAELKGFRCAIESMGFYLNVSTKYEQIFKIEIAKGDIIEGLFLDIEEPKEF